MPPESDAPVPQVQTRLTKALDEAEALLAFAVRSDKRVADQIIDGIVKAKEPIRSRTQTLEQEIAFWKAFNELTASMVPVTADSLANFEPSRSRRLPWRRAADSTPAAVAARNLRLWTICVLFVLVLTQIYWLVGTSILKDTERLTAEWLAVQTELARVRAAANPPLETGSPLIKPLELREDILAYRLNASYETLIRWNVIWARVYSIPTFWRGALTGEKIEDAPETGEAIVLNSKAEQTGKFAQQSLALYILPLLYGILGAYTQVLRRLNTEVERYTFTQNAFNRYRLQVTLGAVAGPTIGLFFSPEQAQTLFAALSPFAIAFVAGYSVDILFAAVDRVILKAKAGLSDEQEKDAAAAAKPPAAGPTGAGPTPSVRPDRDAAPPATAQQASTAAAPQQGLTAAAGA